MHTIWTVTEVVYDGHGADVCTTGYTDMPALEAALRRILAVAAEVEELVPAELDADDLMELAERAGRTRPYPSGTGRSQTSDG